jgi:hypothetical protein
VDTRSELRLLRALVLVTTTVLGGLSLAAFTRATQRPRFREIDVERINVVEKDGALRLVIANRERSPGPVFRGKPFGSARGKRPGLIFYDDEGTENGGLIFGGKTEDGKVSAVGHLSFDQYGQDQVINLEYEENNGRRQQGLTIADRPDVSIPRIIERRDAINKMPEGPEKAEAQRQWIAMQGGTPFGALRVFVGRDPDKAAVVNLKDHFGRTRLRLVVDSSGAASVDFLDQKGHVTYTLPDSARRATVAPTH